MGTQAKIGHYHCQRDRIHLQRSLHVCEIGHKAEKSRTHHQTCSPYMENHLPMQGLFLATGAIPSMRKDSILLRFPLVIQ